jgi:hypothetical protein
VRNDISATALGTKGYGAAKKSTEGNRPQAKRASGYNTPKGQVLDGFIKNAASSATGMANRAKSGVAPIISTSTGMASTGVRRTAQSVHRNAQRSKTLVRAAVSKPTPKQSENRSLFINKAANENTRSTSPRRMARAKTISKSKLISRFSPFSNSKNASPEQLTALDVAPQSTATKQPQSSAAAVPKPLPSMVTSASHQHLERLLDQALHGANSHRRALEGKTGNPSKLQKIYDAPRWMSFGSVLLVVALLVGFFAWQNVPQVSMRIAAAKTNINASVPSYTPPGFSFTGPINYTDREVSINFKSNNNDSRNFTITQEASTETSPSLAENNLASDKSVQTSQVNGTTVYIYGEQNHATWVNHGVRYTIEDKADLNTEQILKIASGL